jgi:glutamate N-acetyltransferase/amino-acid N-acetyltransferase
MIEMLHGGLEEVPGYRYGTVACGIRYPDRLDYACILTDSPCVAAGVFTQNRMAAPPVHVCRARVTGEIRGILVNSTNANACTGEEGLAAARLLTRDLAQRMGAPEESILMASTGIIGQQLPVEKMLASHDELLKSPVQNRGGEFARAIMTTDKQPKFRACRFQAGNRQYTLAGTLKGAGMIAPDMATMLCFLVTDAPLDQEDLDRIFRHSVDTTLNRITIDGDTSTNDTAIILSPASGKSLSGDDLETFREALDAILRDLAHQLMVDGEGVEHIVTIQVNGAENNTQALRAARTMGQSLLVKTAIHGRDPNWGRIAMALGNAEVVIVEDLLSISFGDLKVFQEGEPRQVSPAALEEIMSRREYTITVNLGIGQGTGHVITSDLSYEYVRINAEYST